jgi:hypothetical protein
MAVAVEPDLGRDDRQKGGLALRAGHKRYLRDKNFSTTQGQKKMKVS